MTDTIHFVVPGSLNTKSGGYGYDRRIIEGLRALGRNVRIVELGGDYPEPNPEDREHAARAFASIPAGERVIVDGLAFGALAEIAEKEHTRLDLIALVHHPLADETGLDDSKRKRFETEETRALAFAKRVVTTSAFTARRLADYGVPPDRISVVEPGVAPARRAKGSMGDGVRMLCPASYIPRKGHILLLTALAELCDPSWRLTCVGNTRIDPACFRNLHKFRDEAELKEQVDLHDEVDENELASLYESCDVLVLASHYEGFGMVVTEAIARGIPVVATKGGALGETLPEGTGLLSAPGDVPGLKENLRRFVTDGALRARLATAAIEARYKLPTWAEAAQKFDAVLFGLPGAFTRDWLSLREDADSRARDASLVESLVYPENVLFRVIDLGAGTGNNLRYLAPRIRRGQYWLLLDADFDLLSSVRVDDVPISIEGHSRDLATELESVEFFQTHLVTASAFLDLVSKEWLERLAAKCAEAKVPNGLFVLNVDGHIVWDPKDPDDEDIALLFNAHMHGDKGFGPALGPDAPAAMEEAFSEHGYEVIARDSPWRLGKESMALQMKLLQGYAEAAAEMAPARSAMIDGWFARRRSLIGQGESELFVGHRDVLVRRSER